MARATIVSRHRDVVRQNVRIVLTGCFSRTAPFSGSSVRNEFHQRTVGIAKIDAGAGALGAEPLQRPGFDGDTTGLQVADRIRDRAAPFEAQVAVAGRDR